jgi:5-methylcytosine-specific restriction protein B
MIENGDSEKEIFDTITNNEDKTKVELDKDTFKTIKDDKRVEFVTFHQSYSYEDFIEGFRPNEKGNIKLENGIFKNIVNEALKQPSQNFYIVIDEINRGNISKIFGELITLIEEDKRDKYEVTLPYSKEGENKFKIPSNLYIIAPMNSTDKSIATIDIALRRRFTFLKMKPNLELVNNLQARELMSKLNEYIYLNINEDYMLGHSYFMKIQNNDDLEFIKEYKIKPLLEEYFYADDIKLDEVLEIFNIKKENIKCKRLKYLKKV